jgi:hypothetical protein
MLVMNVVLFIDPHELDLLVDDKHPLREERLVAHVTHVDDTRAANLPLDSVTAVRVAPHRRTRDGRIYPLKMP